MTGTTTPDYGISPIKPCLEQLALLRQFEEAAIRAFAIPVTLGIPAELINGETNFSNHQAVEDQFRKQRG